MSKKLTGLDASGALCACLSRHVSPRDKLRPRHLFRFPPALQGAQPQAGKGSKEAEGTAADAGKKRKRRQR